MTAFVGTTKSIFPLPLESAHPRLTKARPARVPFVGANVKKNLFWIRDSYLI
jgi:hypothetical protein